MSVWARFHCRAPPLSSFATGQPPWVNMLPLLAEYVGCCLSDRSLTDEKDAQEFDRLGPFEQRKRMVANLLTTIREVGFGASLFSSPFRTDPACVHLRFASSLLVRVSIWGVWRMPPIASLCAE